MKNIKIGVIADDFTGASDAASFLQKSGLKTIMYTKVPSAFNFKCDAIVIALKSRSVSAENAINMTKKALQFLKSIDCEKYYFKYCSTFDSTPYGNIGVVMDYLMDELKQNYSILCPSLPSNGRTVKNGILYVDGIPLAESSMKNHPLNPMWDSYIPKLMEKQSKYPSFVLSRDTNVVELLKENEKFYLVPDYENDSDGITISENFKHLKLLSGGSGLLEFLFKSKHKGNNNIKYNVGKSIILCGSCSRTTKQQIDYYKEQGGETYSVDSKMLLNNKLSAKDIFNNINSRKKTVLVYSSAIEEQMDILKQSDTFEIEAKLMETTMSGLSKMAKDNDYNNIVVAGGETSGSVTMALGYEGFIIGDSIDPGIPFLYPINDKNIRVVLKSGNFGSKEFFIKAIGEGK